MGQKTGLSNSKLASNYILVGVEDKQFKKSLMDIAYPKAIKKWGDRLWAQFRHNFNFSF